MCSTSEDFVSPLDVFSLTLEGGKNVPPPSGDAFVCDNFSLSCPGQTLFENASITLVQGKRYGILGPNGQGKTTIVRHIAAREMPVPLNWDVILVEQEAKASNRSAVEEVIAADEKTNELITKEKELTSRMEDFEKRMEAGEDVSVEELNSTRNELELVAADLEVSGAESAEGRVRKALGSVGLESYQGRF